MQTTNLFGMTPLVEPIDEFIFAQWQS